MRKKNGQKFHCEVVRGQETFIKIHTTLLLYERLWEAQPPGKKKVIYLLY